VSQGRITVVDARGQNAITVINMESDVGNAALGDRVLIASSTFAEHTSPHAIPDFLMTNIIPASYLAAGSLIFKSDTGTIYWRLSWGGDAYTGSTVGSNTNDDDGDFGPPFNKGLPTCGTYVLKFQNAANAKSMTNADDYRFEADQAESFFNNAGTTFNLTGTKPTVTIRTVDDTASEVPLSDVGKTRIVRTGCLDLSLSVSYTIGGTANNGADYQMLSGKATIPVDSDSVVTTIRPINDDVHEPNETVIQTVKSATNYIVGSPKTSTITIHSNE